MGTAVSMEGSFLLNLPLGELVWALLFLISNSSNQVWESRTQRFLPAKTWLAREWDRRTPKLMTSSTSLVSRACTWRKGLLIVHKLHWLRLDCYRVWVYFTFPCLHSREKKKITSCPYAGSCPSLPGWLCWDASRDHAVTFLSLRILLPSGCQVLADRLDQAVPRNKQPVWKLSKKDQCLALNKEIKSIMMCEC